MSPDEVARLDLERYTGHLRRAGFQAAVVDRMAEEEASRVRETYARFRAAYPRESPEFWIDKAIKERATARARDPRLRFAATLDRGTGLAEQMTRGAEAVLDTLTVPIGPGRIRQAAESPVSPLAMFGLVAETAATRSLQLIAESPMPMVAAYPDLRQGWRSFDVRTWRTQDVRGLAEALSRGVPSAIQAYIDAYIDALGARLASAPRVVLPGIGRLIVNLWTPGGTLAYQVGLSVGMLEAVRGMIELPARLRQVINGVNRMLPDLINSLTAESLVEKARLAGAERGRSVGDPLIGVLSGEQCNVPDRLDPALRAICLHNCQSFEFGRIISPLILEIVGEVASAIASEGVAVAGRALGRAAADLAGGVAEVMISRRRTGSARRVAEALDHTGDRHVPPRPPARTAVDGSSSGRDSPDDARSSPDDPAPTETSAPPPPATRAARVKWINATGSTRIPDVRPEGLGFAIARIANQHGDRFRWFPASEGGAIVEVTARYTPEHLVSRASRHRPSGAAQRAAREAGAASNGILRYDAGHIRAAALDGIAAAITSFPQVQSINRGLWSNIEARVRRMLRSLRDPLPGPDPSDQQIIMNIKFHYSSVGSLRLRTPDEFVVTFRFAGRTQARLLVLNRAAERDVIVTDWNGSNPGNYGVLHALELKRRASAG
jgi:hypothetical protein